MMILLKLVGIWLLCFAVSMILSRIIMDHPPYPVLEGIAAVATIFTGYVALWWYTP